MIRSLALRQCPRRMRPGQVKRVPLKGKLVGYWIACPGCGFVASYLLDEARFTESVDKDGIGLVGIDAPPPCIRCRRRIECADGALRSVPCS